MNAMKLVLAINLLALALETIAASDTRDGTFCNAKDNPFNVLEHRQVNWKRLARKARKKNLELLQKEVPKPVQETDDQYPVYQEKTKTVLQKFVVLGAAFLMLSLPEAEACRTDAYFNHLSPREKLLETLSGNTKWTETMGCVRKVAKTFDDVEATVNGITDFQFADALLPVYEATAGLPGKGTLFGPVRFAKEVKQYILDVADATPEPTPQPSYQPTLAPTYPSRTRLKQREAAFAALQNTEERICNEEIREGKQVPFSFRRLLEKEDSQDS